MKSWLLLGIEPNRVLAAQTRLLGSIPGDYRLSIFLILNGYNILPQMKIRCKCKALVIS